MMPVYNTDSTPFEMTIRPGETMKKLSTKIAMWLQCALLIGATAGPGVAGAEDVQAPASQRIEKALPQDCSTESNTLVKTRADSGDTQAQHLMGMKAYLGACEDRDLDTAVFYLSKSAAKFFPPSMFHLATVLQLRGGARDADLLQLFRGAAERGFAKAEMNVLLYYVDKKSKVYDIAEAYAWHSFCAPHDRFCDWPQISEALSHMSKSEKEKGEILKTSLFEKMKSVERFDDIFCCAGTRAGSSSGFGWR